MSDGGLDEIERQVGRVADGVVRTVDRAVDGMGEMLTGESGRKLAGGAAVGVIAAAVLPVSVVGGALLGAGYAAFRQIGRPQPSDVAPPRRD